MIVIELICLETIFVRQVFAQSSCFLTKCQTSFERLSQWLVWDRIHLSFLKTTSSLCFRDTDIKGYEIKDGFPWTPTPYTVFKIIMSARLCAASWNIVGDCDETFNYWEPVSQMLSRCYMHLYGFPTDLQNGVTC